MQYRFSSILAGTLSALVLAVAPTISFAHDGNGHSLGDRFHNQRHRLTQGIRQDEINRWEARKLTREQYRLRQARYRMRHDDGHLSWQERARLQHRLNKSSRHIYRARHN